MDVLVSRRVSHRVRTLSTILGETMCRQTGKEFLNKVEKLRQRLANLIDGVNATREQTELLENSPEIKQTLSLRHPYTEPIHLLQIELIKRCRAGNSVEPTEAQKALLVTIAGIAASMLNTG